MAFTTINKSTDFYNTLLYSGNGSTQTISGAGFQPDVTWIKCRTDTESHRIYDVPRGATKELYPNLTLAEGTNANSLTSWNSDGFAVGTESSVNASGQTFASWNWKGGTTSGITTDGNTTITPSSYSFNATSGVACLLFTGNGTAGAKLAHGMGKTPKFWMIKRQTDGSESWTGYHVGLGATKFISLNGSGAEGTATNRWNDTAPDSVNITLGSEGSVNSSGNPLMCYAFSEVPGFSAMGYYTGNGSANGTFVYTGFKPSFILLKDTGTNAWYLMDSKRNGYNFMNKGLIPDQTAGEQAGSYGVDFLATGFNWRTTDGWTNGNNLTYLYVAFGNTIVGTNNIPALAR